MSDNYELELIAIGQRIRTERVKLKFSREVFAEMVELSDYYVGQLERGERTMSVPTLAKISINLRVSLDHLIFGPKEDTDLLKEGSTRYGKGNTNSNNEEINQLLTKCSDKELELIATLIKTLIPYFNLNNTNSELKPKRF